MTALAQSLGSDVQPDWAKDSSVRSAPSCPGIAIHPPEGLRRYGPLWLALEQAYQVRFVPTGDVAQGRCEAMILVGASVPGTATCVTPAVRTLAFLRDGPSAIDTSGSVVAFTHSERLHSVFRGASIRRLSAETGWALRPVPGDEVLATQNASPLWVQRREASTVVDFVAAELPVLGRSEYLFSRFEQPDWFALVPLLQFVQEVSGWVLPPLRACFMFDDPNLHWRSYGHVSFRDVAAHARAYDYHAAFATVPLDWWYVHSPTARLFRENHDRLSILIHGNDHTHYELHRAGSVAERLAIAAQAMRRMERVERTTGLPVDRIMAAPHGACSEEMAIALLRTGFEAASISRGSLMARNPYTAWPASIGLETAAFLGGLPIIPRFNIRSDPERWARLAGFLGQGIIGAGHHDDLRDGVAFLESVSGVINSLGHVQWCSPLSIAETNYHWRLTENVLTVRLFSRRVKLRVPPTVTRLHVVRPWLQADGVEPLRVLDASGESEISEPYNDDLLAVSPGTDLTIVAPPPNAVRLDDVPARRTRAAAFIRRQLCESRDRMRPIVSRIL